MHVSALEMKCPEAFRRRYIEREIIPPGVAMVVGTGTHRAIERNLANKVGSGNLLPVDQIKDIARDGVNQAWESGIRLDDNELQRGIKIVKGEAVDKAVRLSVLHHSELAPVIEPTHVERSWSLELDGYPVNLVGTIDIQEGSASVRDTKTTGKTPAADCADKSLQLKAYSLAVKVIDGVPPQKAYLDYLIDTARPKSQSFETEPTAADFQALLARIENLTVSMEKGVFQPVEPTHWCCCPKWCGFALTCRYYVAKPKQFAA